jgi:protein phosphatase
MSAADAAGLSDEQLESIRTERPSRAERRANRRGARKRGGRTRITWRVLVFVVLVLAVIGGALATIQWYGTSTYYVAFEQDEVVIYQGRPGGILWVDPELEDRTGIERNDVPSRFLDALDAGSEQPSLAEAQAFVANIERDIEELEDSTSPTTTRPSSTTSTTAGTTTTRSP